MECRMLGGGTLRTLALIIAIMTVSAAAAWAQDAAIPPELSKPINIDQALEIAFRQSPELKVAVNQLRKAGAVVEETSANFNPRFSATVTQQYQGPPITINVPGVGSANVANVSQSQAAGSVFLPLDTNKKLGYVSDISKLQFRMDYLSLTGTAEKLIFNVKSAYYDLLRAAGLEGVAQAAVDVAAERLKDANANYKAGASPKFDVTRAEVEVANLNQRLIVAKNGTAKTRAAFNKVLGVDVNTPTAVVKAETPINPELKVDIPANVKVAFANRPEVKQAETAVELNKRNVKSQVADLFPSMDVSGTWTHQTTPSGFSTSQDSWIALLSLRIPVWNGGITRAKIHQARADVAKAQDGVEQVKLGVSLEVRTAALNLQEAMERVSTTAEGVRLAEESLRLATVRYKAGYSPLVEVSDAESALTEARFNFVQAEYDSVIAQAELERATATQPEAKKLELLGAVRVAASP
jgi:outer membrane protein